MSIAIDQAFIDTILSGGLSIDVVHENGGYSVWGGVTYSSVLGVYTPTAGREFCEIRTFPANTQSFTLNDTDENVGLFQVILKFPNDAGAFTAKTKAESVLALFKAGTSISYGGQVVHIVSSNRDGGRNDGGYYQIVIRANYQAFVAK